MLVLPVLAGLWLGCAKQDGLWTSTDEQTHNPAAVEFGPSDEDRDDVSAESLYAQLSNSISRCGNGSA